MDKHNKREANKQTSLNHLMSDLKQKFRSSKCDTGFYICTSFIRSFGFIPPVSVFLTLIATMHSIVLCLDTQVMAGATMARRLHFWYSALDLRHHLIS